ncbi:hypothetical protein PENSPDRAFT_504361 [Peniophora sp. CONT]|nr:hypothetical protein PENSPDRAFT_504361 [Peniophora sp. CONT]
MPAPVSPFRAPYELCTTRKHVHRALSILSGFPLVVLDCEGRSLGQSDGTLSLLCLGTPVAGDSQHVFLFDMQALAPCPRSRGAIAAFLERGPIKVCWDGRMDAIEIFHSFGIPLTGVLDLQVVEVVARQTVLGEKNQEREERLAKHKFGYRFVEEHRARMGGLHVVRGLQNCVEFYHPDLHIEKDASVVEMHQNGETHRWMERPLPANLLHYAANDIRLIAHILSIFDTLGFFQRDFWSLVEKSNRYIARTQRVQIDEPLRPSGLLLLESLSDESAQHECVKCGALLPLSCFENLSWRIEGARGTGVRRRHCQLCVTTSLRDHTSLPKDGSEWVETSQFPTSTIPPSTTTSFSQASSHQQYNPYRNKGRVPCTFLPLLQPQPQTLRLVAV